MSVLFVSNWEFDDALAFFHGDVVPIKEINIESSLECATQNLRPAVEAVDFVSVEPVEDVEEPIHAQGCHVVRGYVLNYSDLVQHYDLGHKRNTFKP